MGFDLEKHPHRRYNPLLDEWVLVSPHRTQRPWQGAQEGVAESRASYDPGCYLCPGNARANGERNPDYADTFVFRNDFAALLPETPEGRDNDPLFRAESVRGECRVICFSPRHDLTLADLPPVEIRRVIETWIAQTEELGERYAWVQVFENKGAAMGCSNPHPHGQVWAGDWIPDLPRKEDAAQRDFLARHGTRLLQEVVRRESGGPRVFVENEGWLWIVPFWAVWPFETLLLPKRPAARLPDLDAPGRDGLAEILSCGLAAYDRLFETSFPYSMGWHGAPFGSDPAHWTLHAHVYPPLLRSATVKKFMVGYEMLAMPQRDLTPEKAAERLREAVR